MLRGMVVFPVTTLWPELFCYLASLANFTLTIEYAPCFPERVVISPVGVTA